MAEFEGIRANADTALESACRRRGHEAKTDVQRGFPRGRRALWANPAGGGTERRNSKNVPEMFSFVQFSTTSDPGRVCAKLSRADVPRSGVSVERRSADFGPAGFRLARPPTAPWRARKNFVQKRARLQPLTLNNPVFTGFGTVGTVSKLSWHGFETLKNRAESCQTVPDRAIGDGSLVTGY